ncbi:hypothetical protein GCM10010124_38560 [Pilimelia terevasa]|uniref:SCP2 domain-containing protein n=1 Tax=Pilimelia terevasa TaxID=53372 RepID=A0A8J3FK24_9ACTN|nr:SCP2 sterol-binding domain-containing protein [Pilimelia terevasa]GGK42058.1 hypothetical protein GCM10010124_38560 [Pilimelia terevasa]
MDARTTTVQELSRRRLEPAPGGPGPTVKFVIPGPGGCSWLVRADCGQGERPPRDGPDCVVTATEPVLRALLTGRANTLAAVLRGEVAVSGDLDVLVALQRLFPGPPAGSRGGAA